MIVGPHGQDDGIVREYEAAPPMPDDGSDVADTMTRSETSRFVEILHELEALHAQKNYDYGRPQDPYANVRASEEWGVPGWTGGLIRATDKLRRLQTFARRGTLANEGVRDSLLDLAAYAIIALVLFDELTHATLPKVR